MLHPMEGQVRHALRMQVACVFCANYHQHCLPCPEGIEIGWVIWDLDQIPARGIEQVKEWYAGFPVKALACVECGVCVERCPFDVEIIERSLLRANQILVRKPGGCQLHSIIGPEVSR